MLEKPMYRGSVSHFRSASPFQSSRAHSCQRRGGRVLRGAGEHPLYRRIRFGQQVPLVGIDSPMCSPTGWDAEWSVVSFVTEGAGERENYTNTPQHSRSLNSNSGSATYQLCDLDENLSNSVSGSVRCSLKYFMHIFNNNKKKGRKRGSMDK